MMGGVRADASVEFLLSRKVEIQTLSHITKSKNMNLRIRTELSRGDIRQKHEHQTDKNRT